VLNSDNASIVSEAEIRGHVWKIIPKIKNMDIAFLLDHAKIITLPL